MCTCSVLCVKPAQFEIPCFSQSETTLILRMALTYEEVLKVWQGLEIILGMSVLNEKGDFGHECLRETLIRLQCLPLFNETPENMDVLLSMVQLLTVLRNMTFYASMNGGYDGSEITTWIHHGRDVVGPAQPTRELKDVVGNSPEHIEDILDKSIQEVKHLQVTCSSDSFNVQQLLSKALKLLEQVAEELSAI